MFFFKHSRKLLTFYVFANFHVSCFSRRGNIDGCGNKTNFLILCKYQKLQLTFIWSIKHDSSKIKHDFRVFRRKSCWALNMYKINNIYKIKLISFVRSRREGWLLPGYRRYSRVKNNKIKCCHFLNQKLNIALLYVQF